MGGGAAGGGQALSLQNLAIPNYFVFSFPTCQVRVVRFYVNSFSSASLSSPLRNCQLPMAVCPTGPQWKAPNGSVPLRASSRWQCSPPHLNRKLPKALFPTGPQPRAQDGSVPSCQIECQNLCPIEGQNLCHIECLNLCLLEGPNLCRIECQNLCGI